MFENLTGRLEATLKRLRGEARLTEANISDSLREVRMALLEADVALPVVKALIEDVRVKAVEILRCAQDDMFKMLSIHALLHTSLCASIAHKTQRQHGFVIRYAKILLCR